MKTNKLSTRAAGDQGRIPLYSKMFFISLILALVLAALPVASALAAPAQVLETDDLAAAWQNKLHNLHPHSLFYEQVRLYPTDYDDPDELANAYDLLHQYGLALRSANTIVSTHSGFDLKGKVVNEKQAVKSIEDLAENLRIMRAIWMKLDERGYEFHRMK